MKIDHIVLNIDEKYQNDNSIITKIRNNGLLYEPQKGKGTGGFKVSNIWIGEEYFEMVNILKEDGGGWIKEWTDMYNRGHRGLICLIIEVEDIDKLYSKLQDKKIEITKPEWLKIRLFFNLISKKMPWKNAYLPFFSEVPFQLGFQQLKDESTREYMRKRMEPNTIKNNINGIKEINIYGNFKDAELDLMEDIFDKTNREDNNLEIVLNTRQRIRLIKSEDYKVEVLTDSKMGNEINIENLKIIS